MPLELQALALFIAWATLFFGLPLADRERRRRGR